MAIFTARWGVDPGLGGLDRIAWEGGPAYYEQFTKADAAGWSDPTFFPVGIYLSPPETPHPANALSAGINHYIGINHNPPLSQVTGAGVHAVPQMEEWTTGEVGADALAVAWFTTDEPDMNVTLGDENDRLAFVQAQHAEVIGRADGRFSMVNIGNGVNRTFWSPNTVDDMVRAVDAAAVDQYVYTSSVVRGNVEASPYWPVGVSAKCAAAYGWLVDQMHSFHGATKKPVFITIETAEPLLFSGETEVIPIEHFEGAVWAAICHEARGIMLFQHNSDTTDYPFYSVTETSSARRAQVEAVLDKVHSLASAINTQSYVHDFGDADIFTMLKTYDGHAYIFAHVALGGSPGAGKTFSLPAGINGTTAEVVGESRNISITAGSFTDTFAAEYTHHVYKIPLAAP